MVLFSVIDGYVMVTYTNHFSRTSSAKKLHGARENGVIIEGKATSYLIHLEVRFLSHNDTQSLKLEPLFCSLLKTLSSFIIILNHITKWAKLCLAACGFWHIWIFQNDRYWNCEVSLTFPSCCVFEDDSALWLHIDRDIGCYIRILFKWRGMIMCDDGKLFSSPTQIIYRHLDR